MDEASQLRHRAFTLFVEAYEEVRRGILFLRWHAGDANTLTPSRHGGPGPRRRAATKPKRGPVARDAPAEVAR